MEKKSRKQISKLTNAKIQTKEHIEGKQKGSYVITKIIFKNTTSISEERIIQIASISGGQRYSGMT
jgi:hypothetical protein